MTTSKKKFRMTTKRKIMVESIITTINIRLNSYEEDGLARMMVENNSKLTEEEREVKMEHINHQQKHFSLLHDVLEVYASRHWEFLLDLHMKEKRGWKTEYDIPLDVFNQAIEDTIGLLNWYIENSVTQMTEKRLKDRDEKVALLLELKQYRNEQELLSA